MVPESIDQQVLVALGQVKRAERELRVAIRQLAQLRDELADTHPGAPHSPRPD
jgi:hypothetical protein